MGVNLQTIREGIIGLCPVYTETGNATIIYLEAGEVMVRLPRGESYPIRTPGKIIGWSFLIPPNRYTASGQTVVPSSLLVMQSPDFYYLIHKEPRMGVKVMANLAQVVAGRLLQWAGQPG